MHNLTETDPKIAHANCVSNMGRLVEALPNHIQEMEDRLPSLIAQLPRELKLTAIYRAMDEIGKAITPHIACQSGCSSCCHYNVQLYPIEVDHIEKQTGHGTLPNPIPSRDFNGLPCPFLRGSECGIYEFRPMSCRKHVALTKTPYWCHPSRCGNIELPLLEWTGAKMAFQTVIADDGRLQPRDIRQVFGQRNRFSP